MRDGDIAQLVEHLPSMCRILSLIPYLSHTNMTSCWPLGGWAEQTGFVAEAGKLGQRAEERNTLQEIGTRNKWTNYFLVRFKQIGPAHPATLWKEPCDSLARISKFVHYLAPDRRLHSGVTSLLSLVWDLGQIKGFLLFYTVWVLVLQVDGWKPLLASLQKVLGRLARAFQELICWSFVTYVTNNFCYLTCLF